ncbi:vacuolar ATP synthase subunit S1 [Ancylostoma caninum]|uniref:Vacuolar ATP synthase subunit S1 n=1 Tax=Ancylostoma caninum TaxID=29170 RepID=A0A368GNP5_ANCCA|nr:vacuolar ATP synthase subunit S1 [Ancylostoma caninum]
MRVLIAVLLTVSSVKAYDAVVFSSEQKITKDYPTIENLLSTASSKSPVVFIVNPDFTLGQFSREANAYSSNKEVSGLPATVKSAAHHVSRHLTESVYAPGAVTVTSMDNFTPGADIYILAGEEWKSMQSLAEAVLPKLGEKYTAVITATEAVSADKSRVKRVVTSEMEHEAANPSGNPSNAGGPEVSMPMTLPPYNRSQYPDVKPGKPELGSCLLYLEGVNIVVQNSKKAFATIPIRSLTNTTSWSYADGDVKCNNATNGTYSFIVRLNLKGDVLDSTQKLVKISSGSQVVFKLIFTGALGWWKLTDVVADSISVQGLDSHGGTSFISGTATAQSKVISQTSVNNVGFVSVPGYAFACSDSQAAFFKTNQDGVLIGISLYNTEVQTLGVWPDKKTQQMYFTRQVEDCIGTFSVGSWMGIISALILFGGFIFGFLMLNSVQTMDRFDDPKHKQIVINVRE